MTDPRVEAAADRYMHTLDFIGPEDCGDIIEAAEQSGFTFEGGAAELDQGQDWRPVRDARHRERYKKALEEIYAFCGRYPMTYALHRVMEMADDALSPTEGTHDAD